MLFVWLILDKLLHSTSSRVNAFLECHATLCQVTLFIVWPHIITFIWLVINSTSSHDVYGSQKTCSKSNLTSCQHTICIWAFAWNDSLYYSYEGFASLHVKLSILTSYIQLSVESWYLASNHWLQAVPCDTSFLQTFQLSHYFFASRLWIDPTVFAID